MTSDSKGAGTTAGDRRSPPDAIPAQLIYESTSDAMWVIRVEPDDRFVITSINPAYTALTGIAAEAMVGRTPADLLHGDDLTHVLARHREASRQQRPLRYEESILVGRPILAETTLTPVFDGAGRCTHILGCTRDISERKASELAKASLQDQLREARSSNVIGSLASGIANEFANMLEVVQRHLEIARRDARRSAKVLKSLAATSKACSHASEVTRQISAFGKAPDAARQTAELPQLVREAVQLARTTRRNGHGVRYSDAGSPPPVSIDRPQFQQAIISLLLVASRFIGKRPGEVSVHVDAVAVAGAELTPSGNAAGTTFARIGIEATASSEAPDSARRTRASVAPDLAAVDASDTDVEFARRVIAAHQGATIVNAGPAAELCRSVETPSTPRRHRRR